MASTGFRLDDSHREDVRWFLRHGAAAVTGLAGQSYDPRSSGLAGDHLYAQERIVAAGEKKDGPSDITRSNRVLAARAGMIGAGPKGHERWLHLVESCGPYRHWCAGPDFEADLAPLVRFTDRARELAIAGWDEYWCTTFQRRYAEAQEYARGVIYRGTTGSLVARVFAWLDEEPSDRDAALAISWAISRAVDSKDAASLEVMRGQADALLSDASRAYADAAGDLLREAQRESALKTTPKTRDEQIEILGRIAEQARQRRAAAAA